VLDQIGIFAERRRHRVPGRSFLHLRLYDQVDMLLGESDCFIDGQ
jgi:hypothetical protein